MPGERTRVQAVPGECRGMQGMQGNTGECQANVWELVQSSRGMLGNVEEYQGNVWEWVQTARGKQGNAGLPGEHMGVGVYSQGNSGNYQGNVRGRV